MTILLGNLALTGALLLSAVVLLASVVVGRFSSEPAYRLARWGLLGILGFFTLASIGLVGALVDSDFRLEYVSRFTEKALPIGYKLAAFWAGQEGSLLLWGWLIALFGAIAGILWRKQCNSQRAVSIATLAVVTGFFAALMLFAANPFVISPHVPEDGSGLNPLLQNPEMVAHPPMLFIGYAGFSVPFAMMFGALITRRYGNDWIVETRKWIVVSWMFLTVGIILGAQWAYVELGWGGYWAWDPVENASLLPWLTSTALIHSIMVQQQRGMLKLWNVALIAISFILCLFGTYLTRSGIVNSVHAFGESQVGNFFLVFMLLCIAASVLVVLIRLSMLKAENQLETIWGREGMFLITNVLLVIMTATTIVGTILPVITNAFSGRQVSVAQPFYNKVVVPLGLVLMAQMAIGPLLSYGKQAATAVKSRIAMPLVGGLIVVIVLATMKIVNPWALVCGLILGVALTSVLGDLLRAVQMRTTMMNENPLVALVRAIDLNHRRYGGQMVHLGMLMMMIGIAGSSVYQQKLEFVVSPGQSKTVDGWSAKLISFDEQRKENYTTVVAPLQLTDPKGRTISLVPERRFYDKSEQPSTEVSLDTSLGRDIYMILAGWDNGGNPVNLQLLINPLVLWMWIGGIVMTLGALFALTPRILPLPAMIGQPSDNSSTTLQGAH